MTPTKIYTDTSITPSFGCTKETGYCNTDDCVAVAQRGTRNALNHHKPGLFYRTSSLPKKIHTLLLKNSRPLDV